MESRKYYFTNLPKEIASPEELKQLYGDRWTIEKDYDRLKKNKLYIENSQEED